MRPGSTSRQAGFALLIVLWTLALLALLGSQLLARARGDTAIAHNLLAGATAEAAAYGATQEAIFHLLDGSNNRWAADGAMHATIIGAVRVDITITDEAWKLNLNLASVRQVEALLRECGADPYVAASLAAAIADWRTAGTQPRRLGAKAPQYAAAGRNYAPPRTPFRGVTELEGVLGMTAELAARLRPHLTVFTDANPDRWSPDPVVAAAIETVNGVSGPVGGNDAGPVMIVTIAAVARAADGGSASRDMVVRLNAKTSGPPYEILELQEK